ncbi:glycosyltransferase [Sphingobacterium spiritivorum]|uniref:glycosyltransferase n=1 Tax=Sphingobacterium spiritivorum TaxID=258 RepID=UPI003DA45CA0
MKSVKVLLASYNGESYILEQIQTILGQERVLVDLSVSDDSSTDRTVSVLNENFPDVFVKVNKPGTGSAACNFIKMVCELDFTEKFEYVAFSDQDDVWLPDKLFRAITKLDEIYADLYCSNLTKWDMSTGAYSLLKKDFSQQPFDYLFEGGSAGCTYVFTRIFAHNLQLFLRKANLRDWPELSHDWLVYFYARDRKFKVYIDKNSYIHYRIHSSNVHGHLNKLSWSTIVDKSREVLSGYHQNQVKHFIRFLDSDTEGYKIYKEFLGNYFQRNITVLKYNTKLMRDWRKLVMFTLLNLLRFK